jgi:hypothetical protein
MQQAHHKGRLRRRRLPDAGLLAPPEGVALSAVTVEMRIPGFFACVIIKKWQV